MSEIPAEYVWATDGCQSCLELEARDQHSNRQCFAVLPRSMTVEGDESVELAYRYVDGHNWESTRSIDLARQHALASRFELEGDAGHFYAENPGWVRGFQDGRCLWLGCQADHETSVPISDMFQFYLKKPWNRKPLLNAQGRPTLVALCRTHDSLSRDIERGADPRLARLLDGR